MQRRMSLAALSRLPIRGAQSTAPEEGGLSKREVERDNRLHVMLTDDELATLNDYQFSTRNRLRDGLAKHYFMGTWSAHSLRINNSNLAYNPMVGPRFRLSALSNRATGVGCAGSHAALALT